MANKTILSAALLALIATAALPATSATPGGTCDLTITSVTPSSPVAGQSFSVSVSVTETSSHCGPVFIQQDGGSTLSSSQDPTGSGTLTFNGLVLTGTGTQKILAKDSDGNNAHKSAKHTLTIAQGTLGPLYITPVAGINVAAGGTAQAAAWKDNQYNVAFPQTVTWTTDCLYATVDTNGLVTAGQYAEVCTLSANGGEATKAITVTGPAPPPVPQLPTLVLTLAGLGLIGVIGAVGYARRK